MVLSGAAKHIQPSPSECVSMLQGLHPIIDLDLMQRYITEYNKLWQVPRWHKEEFSVMEGALLWRDGMSFWIQLPELAQVNPWEWYISFKFSGMQTSPTG